MPHTTADDQTEVSNQLAPEPQIPSLPISEVQRIYNLHKRFLSGKVITTPLEDVTLLDDNFPHWIKLETEDPSRPGILVPSRTRIVIPQLDGGAFDDAGFTHDPDRAKVLTDIPNLLRSPHCIHQNLRHAPRGQGGIQGKYVYVQYFRGTTRKVAFTTFNEILKLNALVTSFGANTNWVAKCAAKPALYVRPGHTCTCCK